MFRVFVGSKYKHKTILFKIYGHVPFLHREKKLKGHSGRVMLVLSGPWVNTFCSFQPQRRLFWTFWKDIFKPLLEGQRITQDRDVALASGPGPTAALCYVRQQTGPERPGWKVPGMCQGQTGPITSQGAVSSPYWGSLSPSDK